MEPLPPDQRPSRVSRSVSAPQPAFAPDPPDNEQEDNAMIDEDEVLAQATAIALQAKQELAKNSKGKQPFLFSAINIESSLDNKPKLPMGDLQQRKLIEKKLGHVLDDQPSTQLQVNTSKDSNNNSITGNSNASFLKNVKGAKEKIESLLTQKSEGGESAVPTKTAFQRSLSPLRDSAMAVDRSSPPTIAPTLEIAPVKPTLSATVWKRRNGYGKFSMYAWEQRRMDLVGTKVMYFKCTDGKGEQQDSSNVTSPVSTANELKSPHEHCTSAPHSPTKTPDTTSESMVLPNQQPWEIPAISSSSSTAAAKPPKKDPKKDIHQFWEQTKQNFTKSINDLSITNTKHTKHAENDDPDAPRGSIDLHKENVSVAAISDHEKSIMSVSPTPYGICMMIKGEDKWKVCFDSHGEMMQWLTVLTEIVVQKSVTTYNQELVRSRNVELSESSGVVSVSSGVTINPGNATVMDIFRPAPEEKDGLWNLDDRFSARNVMNIAEDEDDSENDTTAAEEDETDKVDMISASVTPDLSRKSNSTTESDCTTVENSLICDLPLPMEELILKGAKSGPALFLRGYNLFFVIGLTNISLFWVYVFPIHWLLFPLFMVFVNAIVLILTMETIEKGCSGIDGEIKQGSLTRLIGSIQSFSTGMRQIDNKEENAQKVTEVTIDDKTVSNVTFTNQNLSIQCAKKPIAGTTMLRLSDANESRFVNGHQFIGWSAQSCQDVQVRSHGYGKTKSKIPSPSSLYEVANVDFFESSMRISELASKVVLPKVNFDDDDGEKRWTCPDTFVISLAIPTAEPSFTRSTEDGHGFSITIYYKMRKETRDILKRITAPGYSHANDSSEANIHEQERIVNGVRLFEEWCKKAPHDESWQARFKLVPNILNPGEVGLPNWIGKYCGKPVLIKRRGKTGFLSTHPDVDAFEFDVSFHVFPYLAKKAMAYLNMNIFKTALVSLAFVIEGRSDDELPEILIGDAVKVYDIDPSIYINATDYFAGTAPKSIKLD